MIKRRNKRFLDEEDDDPMTGLVNLSDAMLVLALGFLIFAIMALSENPQVLSEIQQSAQTNSGTSVSTGEDFTNDSAGGISSGGSGYSEVGKVYSDPKTGKLVMVQG